MFAKIKVQAAGVLLRSLITACTEKCVRYAQGLAPTVVSISVFDSNNELTKFGVRKTLNIQFRDVWCVEIIRKKQASSTYKMSIT